MKHKKKTHAPPSWAGLAKALEVARRTLWGWRRLEGAPQTSDLKPWLRFVAGRGLGVTSNRLSPERAALLREKMGKEIKLLGCKIARLESGAMPIQEVADLLRFLATFTKTTLAPLGAELASRCAGKSAEELNALGPAIDDEFLARLAEAVTAWDASRAAPAPAGGTNQHLTTRG